jgi:hypothetical protein
MKILIKELLTNQLIFMNNTQLALLALLAFMLTLFSCTKEDESADVASFVDQSVISVETSVTMEDGTVVAIANKEELLQLKKDCK